MFMEVVPMFHKTYHLAKCVTEIKNVSLPLDTNKSTRYAESVRDSDIMARATVMPLILQIQRDHAQ